MTATAFLQVIGVVFLLVLVALGALSLSGHLRLWWWRRQQRRSSR